MNLNILEKNLKLLWLSDNEIKVYLCLTWLWESNLINISKKCALPRTTVKNILDRLIEAWYVTLQKYNNTSNYWIESAEILKKRFETKIDIADNLNYLLKDFYRSNGDIPSSQIYDTKKSIINFIEKSVLSLKDHSTIKVIESPKEWNYRIFFTNEYFENFLKIKKKKNILTQTLIQHDSFDVINKENLSKQYISIKEMNKKIDFKASIWIIDDKIILFTWKVPFIVEISNKIITNSFKSIFDFLWEISDLKYQN